ncbi:MAG TPA: PilT/PilU family type 4a pilus ATPase [Sedimentisphaerales bacterium]|nr:PilT/PilU family type 4a pilus ATPase [Sedimentisphaerales bacterium]
MSDQAGEHSDSVQEPQLHKFFRAAAKTHASDLHLKVGQPPKLRIQGQLKNTTGEPLTKEKIEEMVFEILTAQQKETFLKVGTFDFAHELSHDERFRINIFRQRGLISFAARRVEANIPPFETLNLPPALEKISESRHGLVLVVGPTGCGKTTTIAAMIDYINRTRYCHIITLEDPIEYLFTDKKAIVAQREIGIDVHDFDEALKYLMRHDPDVVFVGEMRDASTVAAAMRASETGHLVLGTMHSANAAQAVQRLLDLFAKDERDLVRQTLSLTLKAIISQILIPSIKEGVDRIPAVEILINNPSVKKLIAEGRETELPDVIKSNKQDGMQDFTDNLCELIKNGSVEPKEAYKYAPNVDELKMALKGIRSSTRGIL